MIIQLFLTDFILLKEAIIKTINSKKYGLSLLCFTLFVSSTPRIVLADDKILVSVPNTSAADFNLIHDFCTKHSGVFKKIGCSSFIYPLRCLIHNDSTVLLNTLSLQNNCDIWTKTFFFNLTLKGDFSPIPKLEELKENKKMVVFALDSLKCGHNPEEENPDISTDCFEKDKDSLRTFLANTLDSQPLSEKPVHAIDYPLCSKLLNILTCKDQDKHPAQELNSAGLVLSHKMSGLDVVTTVNRSLHEESESILNEEVPDKESKRPKAIENETLKIMYRYTLFHEGLPVIDYRDVISHVIASTNTYINNPLHSALSNMIIIRTHLIEGPTDILYPKADPDLSEDNLKHIYIARRGGEYIQGGQTSLKGALFILNSHRTASVTVKFKTGNHIYKPWASNQLTSIIAPTTRSFEIDEQGEVRLEIPANHCDVYTLCDYIQN